MGQVDINKLDTKEKKNAYYVEAYKKAAPTKYLNDGPNKVLLKKIKEDEKVIEYNHKLNKALEIFDKLRETSEYSIYRAKELVSENENIAKVMPGNIVYEDIIPKVISVIGFRKGQVNETIMYDVKYLLEKAFLENKTYVIILDTYNRKYDIKLDIKEYDTNMDVINKIKNAINNLNVNFKASIKQEIVNERNLYKSLLIENTKIGSEQKFKFIDSVGTLAERYNLNRVVEEANDYIYSFDNKNYKTRKQITQLPFNSIRVELRELGMTRIKTEINEEYILENIRLAVKRYNALIITLMEQSKDPAMKLFLEDIRNISKDELEFLESIGISSRESSVLTIDENILTSRSAVYIKDAISAEGKFAMKIYDLLRKKSVEPIKTHNKKIESEDVVSYMNIASAVQNGVSKGSIFIDKIL